MVPATAVAPIILTNAMERLKINGFGFESPLYVDDLVSRAQKNAYALIDETVKYATAPDGGMDKAEYKQKAFEEFAAKLKEMADTLNKAFGLSVPEKEKKKSLSSPARYGMSLKKFRRESFIKQYSYRPIARKHLPYQRRNY